MGPSDYYTEFKLQGREAAAACTLRPDEKSQGIPPYWMIYISVDTRTWLPPKRSNLEARLWPRFRRDGCRPDGRSSRIRPGAVFCVWQANKNAGFGIAQVDGTLCWADLSTPDPKRASDFYSGLFGWQLIIDPKDPSGYVHIKNGEHHIGGIPPASYRQPGMPAHWMAYFQVDDVDATANRRKSWARSLYCRR